MHPLAAAILLVLASVPQASQAHVPEPSANEKTYKVGQNGVQSPRPLNQVEASFSPEASAKQINGRCVVTLIVDSQGKPQNISIIRCTDPDFMQSTMDAVAKYRFIPAKMPTGKPVPVSIFVVVNYKRSGGRDPRLLVESRLESPPGIASPIPDAGGVYPFTQGVAPPKMTHFSDQGFLEAAFNVPGNSPCDVLLTINAKGKPTNAESTHCDNPSFDKLASQSLLKSHFEPGTVNGNPVPVRVIVHLEFAGVATAK